MIQILLTAVEMEKVQNLRKAKSALLTMAITCSTIGVSASNLPTKVLTITVIDQFETSWSDYFFALIAFLILIFFYLLNRPKSFEELSTTVGYTAKKQLKKKPNPHNSNRSNEKN